MEEWKKIDDYENYEISNLGFIRSFNYGRIKILITDEQKNGYLRIGLWENNKKKKFLIHRLVATAFIPNPENKSQVNHIDGNKKNNRLENLEWNTSSENIIHAYKTGLNTGPPKKTVSQYDMNMNFIKEFSSIVEVERELKIYHISDVCLGKRKYSKGFIFKYSI